MWLKSDKDYLRFDEKSNTYDSLEKLLFFLGNIEKNLNFWKWTIVALHNALYNAMILSLIRGNPTRVIELNKILRKKLNKLYGIKKINVNNANQVGKIWEIGKLITFPKAFERIQQDTYIGENVFIAQKHHRKSVEFINNNLRNNFVHFKPGGWSIYIDDLKEEFKNCLEIIEFCLFQSKNVSLEKDEKCLSKDILQKIKNNKEL